MRPDRRLTYSYDDGTADLSVESIEPLGETRRFDLNFRGERFSIESPLPSRFNVMNCLTATGLGLVLGLDPEAIDRGCRSFRGAPGRFEIIVGPDGVKAIVDYAHTPDALAQLLISARAETEGRLIAVIGCGGDRDKTKRPLMGKAAAELSDELIITNDNPRTEDPGEIAKQIVAGLDQAGQPRPSYRVILDRREAIESALREAREGDVVVIAGKGHEDYQILGRERVPFDDRKVAREVLGVA